ncbi:ABC transporter permease [Acetanaerobacterium elongatum]|uniref:Putative ABC transport system permease protein n=1 Tax=Acetanaerobacterium elongatum TaxID=258515 RepID=A0A1G9U6F3_9FIRM|nr:putative ABC transport system permease protein [Acetanaerobacterium elongatum]
MDLMSLVSAVGASIPQGVLWGIMCLGVYITFKVLDFADMTVDGSFALGGSVSAVLIVNGAPPLFTVLVATLAGMLAGVITGVLNTKLKIPAILAGILPMIALYSINIRIMDKSNIPLLGEDTVMTQLSKLLPLSQNISSLVVGVVFCVGLMAFLYWFFGTELGSAIRATGNNEQMVRALGANTDMMKIFGLLIGNGLVAMSGALVSQSQGFADVSMGVGTIVIGLASVIIGEVIFGRRFSFLYKLFSVVMGSIIYRMVIAVVLWLGMKSTDLKLLTAVIVAAALSIPVIKDSLLKPNKIKKAA